MAPVFYPRIRLWAGQEWIGNVCARSPVCASRGLKYKWLARTGTIVPLVYCRVVRSKAGFARPYLRLPFLCIAVDLGKDRFSRSYSLLPFQFNSFALSNIEVARGNDRLATPYLQLPFRFNSVDRLRARVERV